MLSYNLWTGVITLNIASLWKCWMCSHSFWHPKYEYYGFNLIFLRVKSYMSTSGSLLPAHWTEGMCPLGKSVNWGYSPPKPGILAAFLLVTWVGHSESDHSRCVKWPHSLRSLALTSGDTYIVRLLCVLTEFYNSRQGEHWCEFCISHY